MVTMEAVIIGCDDGDNRMVALEVIMNVIGVVVRICFLKLKIKFIIIFVLIFIINVKLYRA